MPNALYTKRQISSMLDLSLRQLTYWTLIGAVKPRSIQRGAKTYHRFTEKDVRLLLRLKELTSQGIPVGKAMKRINESDETGVLPLPFFYQRLLEEEGRAIRFKHSITCLSIRIKRAAQEPAIVKSILSMKRAYDLLTQLRERCFLWILLQTEDRQAQMIAERLQKRFPAYSMTIGIASFVPQTLGDRNRFIDHAVQSSRIVNE
jgi:DNA-binding transcriptional MerR regulator